MTWWEALILGIVQGLTEFFPVSSSGHLVLGQELMDIDVPGIVFDVVVHLATLVSVLFVYRDTVVRLVRGLFVRGEGSTWPYAGKIVLATIPAVIVGLTLKDQVEAQFEDAVFAATMILVTGCVVWSSRWARERERPRGAELLPVGVALLLSFVAGTAIPFLAVLVAQAVVHGIARATAHRGEPAAEPGWGGALLMGVAQALAILPGISRSGSTVIAALWKRIDPVAAAEFSFLMSVPAILGAAVLQMPDVMRTEQLAVSGSALVAGFLGAAIAGILAIRFFVAMLRRQNFHVFAYYCWVAAGLFLLLHGRAA